MTIKKNSKVKPLLIHLGLIILSSALFALSFPNIIFKNGLPFLAWICYVPFLIVINKSNIFACIGWGAIYGFTAYSFFNYWLTTFNPIAGLLTYSIYLIFLAIVFFFLKLAHIIFPNRFYLAQWIIWLAYEYLRTQGFLGYSYGVTGYSQWQIIPLIQIASITGVWGVSALVTFPSFWLSALFTKDFTRRHGDTEDTENKKNKLSQIQTYINSVPLCLRAINLRIIAKEKLTAIVWLVVLIGSFVFGFINMKDFTTYPTAQIALIQHNTDPWEASKAPTQMQKIEAYRYDFIKLARLSDEALASNPNLQLVVWPETSFIPRIYWHTTYRDEQDSWLIVRELLEYLSQQDVPFLIGNDDARMNPAINPDESKKHRVDYNAVMLFENGVNTQTYRKIHLVPFTEHFPYQKQLPRVYEMLENADTHFWEKGFEETVFTIPGFTFSAPICFEDTFGYISRNFVKKGANVLINVTNDAWAKSLSSQTQHLTMAVFRSVENSRSMVRSTSTGQTCSIDPNGRITAIAEPFIETWLNVTVPIENKTTIYTLYGDYLGVLFVIAAIIILLFGAFWYTIRKRKKS